jgi:integrase
LKTWDLAYRIRGAGKVRRVSLGRISDVGLETARERANQLTSAARAGRDLLADEEASRAAAASRHTVEDLITLYVRRRVSGRLRTAREIEHRLNRALGPILATHADELRRRDIRELLDAVVDKGFPGEAEKRRQTIGAMFRWALSQDMLEVDPTAGLNAYEPAMPRDRVLTRHEVATLWSWLHTGALPFDVVDILRLQLLTGARCGEISGIRAEEIDQSKWTWTLPASRSKNNRPRVTPLVGMARLLIQARLLTNARGPQFTSERGTILTSAHVGHYLNTRNKMLPIAKFTTHDLRRTFATMLAEMGVSFDLIAAMLGHRADGRETRTLVRHYIHSDLIERKAEVFERWDRRIGEMVKFSPSRSLAV